MIEWEKLIPMQASVYARQGQHNFGEKSQVGPLLVMVRPSYSFVHHDRFRVMLGGPKDLLLDATNIEAAKLEAEALLRQWWRELGVALGELESEGE